MTNEEKAEQLLWCVLKEHTWDDKRQIKECALLMAEWKDERIKSCFILISKLIKDGVLTKDNPEHIMVEQMMELYNNIKYK